MQPPAGQRSRTWSLLIVIAIASIAITVRGVRRHRDVPPVRVEDPPREVDSDTPIVPETEAPNTEVPHAVAQRVTPVALAPVADVQAAAPPLDLHSAEANVETVASLLREGRDEEFVATFLPSVRPRFTARAIERCRARVVTSNTPLRPDWETAEDSVEDGHRVRRVSMYGHETTGFHEIDGHWLADRAWCVPTDVPDDA